MKTDTVQLTIMSPRLSRTALSVCSYQLTLAATGTGIANCLQWQAAIHCIHW